MARGVAAFLAALLALSVPLAAQELKGDQQNARDWTRCENESGEASADTAITSCTALVQSSSEPLARRAVAYVNRGIAHAGKGDIAHAIADFDAAIGLAPNDAVAYMNRGDAYGAKGEIDRAIADLDQAIELDPTLIAAFMNRGNAYRIKGDSSRAIADFGAALELDPQFPVAFASRGSAYLAKGEVELALADLSRAIELDAQEVDAYRSRGDAYQLQGDSRRAIADYSQAIKLNPHDAVAYRGRGLANFYGGALARAGADLKQAGRLNPKDAYTALWLDLAQRRAHGPSSLRQAVARLDMSTWPAPLVRLYLDELTPEQAVAAAASANPDARRDTLCEADFYAGALEAAKARKDVAVPLLRDAVAGCSHGFIEWGAARAELKLLGVGP